MYPICFSGPSICFHWTLILALLKSLLNTKNCPGYWYSNSVNALITAFLAAEASRPQPVVSMAYVTGKLFHFIPPLNVAY